MSCYEGEILPTDPLPEEWHEIETLYDSQPGQSPLANLCRACRDRSIAVHAPSSFFDALGTNPSDIVFASINYNLYPLKNPLNDIRVTLEQIHERIVLLSTSSFVDPATCIQWAYHEDIIGFYDTYLESIVSLDVLLKEDWLPLILAMRTFFDSISELSIYSTSWTEGTITIGAAGSSFTDVVNKTNGVDFDTLSGGGVGVYITVPTGESLYPQPYLNNQAGILSETGYDLVMGFDLYETCGPTVGEGSLVESNINGGWAKAPHTATVSVLVKVTDNPEFASAILGIPFPYTVVLTDNNGLLINATPSSGTVTFLSLSQAIDGKYIEIDLEVLDESIPDGSSWDEYQLTGELCAGDGYLRANITVEFETTVFNICEDACGFYHLQE